ncbi:MAG: arginine 2,3-aminomutase [Alphaproteobacteria bacterium]|nr:arginine 2,3-aminomutase [Alphaproteobacteria bacterium]
MTDTPAHEDAVSRPAAQDWGDWRKQMARRITTLEQLRAWIDVTPEEEEAILRCKGRYRWSITQHYASLMDPHDPRCPIRLQAVPGLAELTPGPTATVDPVGDRVYRKTNRVIHKYPDRVVFLVTAVCPVYCRHCTRKFHTTDQQGTYFEEKEARSFEPDFAYIAAHPEIRDVLLTGGDPLVYPDEKIAFILENLRAIPHVEVIRIGSRFPVLMPDRITPELCRILEAHHPVWLNTHFNHPKEITPASAAACDRLLRHGVPVQNQSVLLKGVNDDIDTMRALVHGLLKIRVRPYYLYHCDDVVGVSHFMTSLEEGRAIMEQLTGFTTGFAVPQYVYTTDLGKIPASREVLHRDALGDVWVENYQGQKRNLGPVLR